MSGVDREFAGTEQSIGAMQGRLDALEAKLGNGLSRRPTGDIEASLRTTAKAGTLILDGSLVSRTTYAALWKWVQDNGLVIAGRFTAGDGSTTFGLPDMRGRVLLGAGTLGADVYAAGATGGAATKTLTTANMPAHDHNVTETLTHAGHAHAVFGAGGHGGHFPGESFTAASGTALGLAAWNSAGVGNGNHEHGMTTENVASHTISESVVGSGSPLDVRQPYNAVHWLIWT